MDNWLGVEEDFVPESDQLGFVYIMTVENPDTGDSMYYIGCKKFWSTATRPPLKGKKRRRKITKESDWRSYTSSSPTLNEWIGGGAKIEREVLKIVGSKWELNYFENLYIMNSHAVFRDDFLNGVVNLRQNKPPKALKEKFNKGEIDFELPEKIIEVSKEIYGQELINLSL